MKHDDFGDRMKELEQKYTSVRVVMPDILCVRIDGKKFSKFTKRFLKPFDSRITDAMQKTACFLLEKTNATVSYVQSDEITLIFIPTGNEYIFGGKISKINSILASMATAKFNQIMQENNYVDHDDLAYFDCRSWAVPSIGEASNTLLWRIHDCRKNSVSCLYRWTAGHACMKNKNQKEMVDDLNKNYKTSWNSLAWEYKYGTIYKRVPVIMVVAHDGTTFSRSKICEINPTDFCENYDFKERENFFI